MKKPFRFLSLTGKRAVVVLVSVILVAVLAVDATLAYLITRTDTFENIFTPPVMRLSLEGIDDITNTGDVPMYVRALGVANWVSVDDEHTILAEDPLHGDDFTIDFVTEGWFLASDGFYYYENVLAPGEQIQLFLSATQLKEKAGYELRLEILSSGIQATPTEAIAAAWPAVRITENGTLAEAEEVAR